MGNTTVAQQGFPTRPFKTAPGWSFLEGAAAKAILAAYQEKAGTNFGGASALNVLRLQDGVVVGSNPCAAVLIEEILREQFPGHHVATPADLERALQSPSGAELRGLYVMPSIVLRGTYAGQNQYLALRLCKQLPKGTTLPVMIPLTDLILVADEKSLYQVAFDLRRGARPIYAPQFAQENDDKFFSKTDRNGLPIFDESGTRMSCTSSAPLSDMCLDWGAGIATGRNDLGYSDPSGRVVVVSGGAPRRKIK